MVSRNIVHLIDCMEFMKTCKDKQFDLAITDPPYFSGPDKLGYFGANYSQTKVKRQNYKILGKWEVPKQNYFDELIRISKNQIIWGYNYYKINNIGTGRIVWDKKNDDSTFSKCEIAYNSLIDHVTIFRFMWNGMLQEKMGKNKEKRFHPTQKPVALYKWLLKNYAKPGQTIFDSHVGSGSIRIACYDMGFDFEGAELDLDYFNAQEKRFADHIAQLDLFPKEEIQAEIFRDSDLDADFR